MNETEIDILRDEYNRLTAEIQDRYKHHYHFHYLVFITAGALSAVYFGLTDITLQRSLFLVVPLLLCPIILLMLKEHAYMDIRERYIDTVLRPRLEELVNPKSKQPLLGWTQWEDALIRGNRSSTIWFGLYGAGEYLIPSVLLLWALAAFRHSSGTTSAVEIIIFSAEIVLVVVTIAAALCIRVLRPHFPKTDGTRPTESRDSQGQS